MRAVALGAGVVLAIGVPVATVGSLLIDEGSNAVFPLAGLVIAAFVAGGWLAGREWPASPLGVGAAAALIGCAVAQAVAIVVRIAGDEDVRPGVVAANVGLAAVAGLIGGTLGARGRGA